MKNAGRPQTGEYASYYQRYIDLATEDDVVAALDAQSHETATLLGRISEQQAAPRSDPDQGTVKPAAGNIPESDANSPCPACAPAGCARPLPASAPPRAPRQAPRVCRPFCLGRPWPCSPRRRPRRSPFP